MTLKIAGVAEARSKGIGCVTGGFAVDTVSNGFTGQRTRPKGHSYVPPRLRERCMLADTHRKLVAVTVGSPHGGIVCHPWQATQIVR